MSPCFTNFEYSLTHSTLEDYHEVLVTFLYNNKTIKHTVFVKNKKDADNQYYLDEAKKIIEEEDKNKKLLAYVRGYAKKKYNKGLIALITFLSASAISLAGLFTWKYLASGGLTPKPNPTLYKVSAKVANPTQVPNYGVSLTNVNPTNGQDYNADIVLVPPLELQQKAFLPQYKELIDVKINEKQCLAFTYEPKEISEEGGIRTATFFIPKDYIIGNITINVTLVLHQPVVKDVTIHPDSEGYENCEIFVGEGTTTRFDNAITFNPTIQQTFTCKPNSGFIFDDGGFTLDPYNKSNILTTTSGADGTTILIVKINTSMSTSYTLKVKAIPEGTSKEIAVGATQINGCTIRDKDGQEIKVGSDTTVKFTTTQKTYDFTIQFSIPNFVISTSTATATWESEPSITPSVTLEHKGENILRLDLDTETFANLKSLSITVIVEESDSYNIQTFCTSENCTVYDANEQQLGNYETIIAVDKEATSYTFIVGMDTGFKGFIIKKATLIYANYHTTVELVADADTTHLTLNCDSFEGILRIDLEVIAAVFAKTITITIQEGAYANNFMLYSNSTPLTENDSYQITTDESGTITLKCTFLSDQENWALLEKSFTITSENNFPINFAYEDDSTSDNGGYLSVKPNGNNFTINKVTAYPAKELETTFNSDYEYFKIHSVSGNKDISTSKTTIKYIKNEPAVFSIIPKKEGDTFIKQLDLADSYVTCNDAIMDLETSNFGVCYYQFTPNITAATNVTFNIASIDALTTMLEISIFDDGVELENFYSFCTQNNEAFVPCVSSSFKTYFTSLKYTFYLNVDTVVLPKNKISINIYGVEYGEPMVLYENLEKLNTTINGYNYVSSFEISADEITNVEYLIIFIVITP